MFSNDQWASFGLSSERIDTLKPKLAHLKLDTPSHRAQSWQSLAKELLKPEDPFAFHHACYQKCFSDWDENTLGPPPAWIPSSKDVERSNIQYLAKKAVSTFPSARGIDNYESFHRWSVEHRVEFWNMITEQLGVVFKEEPTALVATPASAKSPEWYPGAKLNIVDSCFQNDDDSIAIVTKSETGPIQKLTYKELETLTNQVANGLVKQGFKPRDAIAIDMIMTAESVAIYLGIVKAGCIVVSIADSFAPNEIETRMKIAGTKAVFAQETITRGGKTLPHYEKVQKSNCPLVIVIPETSLDKKGAATLRPQDIWWCDFLSSKKTFESVSCSPMDTINLLFSSGTTGDPKAIPWNHTSPLKSAMDGLAHHNIKPEQVVAWPTNLGWMMGPWLIFATLVNHATMALFTGSPGTREFGTFVQDAGVQILGVIPSMVKTWRATDCMRGLNWSRIQLFSSTGECSNREDYLFLMSIAGYKPVIEYCGGTEIGGGYLTGTVVQPASPATFSTASLGLDFVIYDEHAKPTKSGELFLIPPSIGLSVTLLNRNHEEAYFADTPKGPNGEVLRRHGDEVEAIANGYFRAHGRVDDTMNLGGIKVSSAEIERSVQKVEGISECAAIAVTPKGGGPSQLVLYVVLSINEAGQKLHAVKSSLKELTYNVIKKELNPLFKVHDVLLTPSLPRTASNKVMRRSLRAEYQKNMT